MDFPSFCRISLKGLKGDSASSCSQRPTSSNNVISHTGNRQDGNEGCSKG
ncbi:hypothetical protein HanXRQr2_Chr03g0103311 [Helianthus annuus]|uniref:Uncharacterized protein n=1 Tax=Helianthus annuus TaxID=4232 RepID=A0A9K3JER5_HELAN|nr:hypothetical protein HanXRQr2_Chr03g0103311 [Helianthus annuus]KAJ0943085.1 hypothetical protein HanPSC8_Chr03g0099801 [Helianthus annuus]